MVAALAPLFVPGFGTTSVLDISRFGSDNRIRVSPLVQMGSILRDTEDHNPPFFEVQVSSNQLSYWQMVALDTFDGNTWEAQADDGNQVTNGSIQLASTPGDTVQQTFTMLDDLGYSWLVAGGDPTSIAINHDVWWHPLSSSLTMDGWPDKGETYQVTSVYPSPKPADLEARNTMSVGVPYTDLPPIPPIIKQRALAWTAGAQTPYDQVMAIMQHLKSPLFTYDPNIDLQDNSQALADFLSQKKGFCQQFASLMAVMLRSIGIPARIGLGFTQGDPVANETGTYIVHGHDYHSWVEVPFEGYGWLTFDPTPRIRRSVEPQLREVHLGGPTVLSRAGPQLQWLEGRRDEDEPPGSDPRGRRQGGHHQRHPGRVAEHTAAGARWDHPAEPRHDRGGAGRPARDRDPAPALAPAAQAPAHRPRSPRVDPRDLRRVHRPGARTRVGRSPGETPEEFRRKLAGADKLDGAAASLTRMTTEVVRAAYAAEEPDADTAASVRHDADEVLHAMRAATPMRERVIGRYRSG